MAWNVGKKKYSWKGWDVKIGEICSIGKGSETEFQMKGLT